MTILPGKIARQIVTDGRFDPIFSKKSQRNTPPPGGRDAGWLVGWVAGGLGWLVAGWLANWVWSIDFDT